MATNLQDNFALQTGLPLDVREKVADLTARDALSSLIRWEGMTVFVLSDKKTYQLQGGITNADWKVYGAGGSGSGGSGLSFKSHSYSGVVEDTIPVLDLKVFKFLQDGEAIVATLKVNDAWTGQKLIKFTTYADQALTNTAFRVTTYLNNSNHYIVSNMTNVVTSADIVCDPLTKTVAIALNEADGQIWGTDVLAGALVTIRIEKVAPTTTPTTGAVYIVDESFEVEDV